jgi:hypothetical protein
MKERVLEGHKSTAFYCKTCRERPIRILTGNDIKMYVQKIEWYIGPSIRLTQETDTKTCDSMKGAKFLRQISKLTS